MLSFDAVNTNVKPCTPYSVQRQFHGISLPDFIACEAKEQQIMAKVRSDRKENRILHLGGCPMQNNKKYVTESFDSRHDRSLHESINAETIS